jgi:hypothetical protein
MNRPTPQERKDFTVELRKKHQPVFNALGIPEAIYIPKMAHHVSGLTGIHMGFFESELNHSKDVYTEMVSMSMEPEDETRTLYKWRHNPHFKEELVPSDVEVTVSTRYYIPFDELVEVNMPATKKRGPYKKKVKPIVNEEVKAPIRTIVVDHTEDLPMEAMTIKDYITIHTGKPVSAKQWINDIITQ